MVQKSKKILGKIISLTTFIFIAFIDVFDIEMLLPI